MANRRELGATQQRTTDNGQRTKGQSGFTLIELLVVILIILIVSVVALPTVLPAISHRQVSEGARILQGALVGARDKAIHDNAPSGIRLLPDPAFPILWLTDPNDPILQPKGGFPALANQIDPRTILASNRIIPIETAPEYREGFINIRNFANPNTGWPPPYPVPTAKTDVYPIFGAMALTYQTANVLMVEESVFDPTTNLPNPPTSWFWNIRVGDRIQIANAGPWYTVVGPMNVGPGLGNSELFVNVGQPGTTSPLQRGPANGLYYPEFLFLVNGQDDDNDGWIDPGWDGMDNNGVNGADELLEWENEQWLGSIPSFLASSSGGLFQQTYTIQRRPAPAPNAREVSLPSSVVIDLTTWNYQPVFPSRERSRLPVNPFSGYADIVINPDGTVVPTTIYSSPSSFGMGGAFFHFWLSERSDLAAPSLTNTDGTPRTVAPYLPLPQGIAPTLFNGQEIKGEYRLVTLFTRTGQIATNDNVAFDSPAAAATQKRPYNQSLPFLEAQQGIRGGP